MYSDFLVTPFAFESDSPEALSIHARRAQKFGWRQPVVVQTQGWRTGILKTRR